MCKFNLDQTVYDRNNFFGKGQVTHIDDKEKQIVVEFDGDNYQYYTFDGERIAQDITLQTEEETFPFKVGDIVQDEHRQFGEGVVTQVDPDYIATALTVKFYGLETPQEYTLDGRFYTNEPVTLELVSRPFTFEVGDYVVDSESLTLGIGQVIEVTKNTFSVKISFPKKGCLTTPYTLDGRLTENAKPTLVLIRRDK